MRVITNFDLKKNDIILLKNIKVINDYGFNIKNKEMFRADVYLKEVGNDVYLLFKVELDNNDERVCIIYLDDNKYEQVRGKEPFFVKDSDKKIFIYILEEKDNTEVILKKDKNIISLSRKGIFLIKEEEILDDF